jgi:hypothetical protein
MIPSIVIAGSLITSFVRNTKKRLRMVEFTGRVMDAKQKDIEADLQNMHNVNWSHMPPSLMRKSLEALESLRGEIDIDQYTAYFPEYERLYLERLERKIEGIFYRQDKYQEYECENVSELRDLIKHAEEEGIDADKIAAMIARVPKYEKTKLLRRAQRDMREWPGRSTLTGERISIKDVEGRIGEANRRDLDHGERKWLTEIHAAFIKKRAEHILSCSGIYNAENIGDMIRTLKLHKQETKALEELLSVQSENERIWERIGGVSSDISDLSVSVAWHSKEARGREEWLREDVAEIPGIRSELQKIKEEGIDITGMEKLLKDIEDKIIAASCGHPIAS